ncbi:MAG: L-histidine N(alpha)-methyltransferase [Anaerolineales bacterium]|jgi:L-histidine N-alpha-methyltransferase
MQRELTIPSNDAFREIATKTEEEEMLAGLMAAQKHLPCKFFYDEAGSKLFEQITRLEEYYPSRTEKSILKRHAGELMRGAEGASLVEIGSGDCSKISILLQALPEVILKTSIYVPVDVSLSAIEESRCKLEERFGAIEVCGIVADFIQQIHLVSQYENKIFCFFGSTIGNLDRRDAVRFVEKLGKLMNTGERLLLGLDMVKDKAVLEGAYNDEKGVTARFNKNILNVANKILGTNFESEYFRHHAFFDEEKQRIEMHLMATRDITIKFPFFEGGLEIPKGQTIHTENSHKFTSHHIDEFASASGLSVRAVYTDSNRWFTLVDYIK